MPILDTREEAADHLSNINPGWESKIDLDLLDMDNTQRCILGQLYGSYRKGYCEAGVDNSLYGPFDSQMKESHSLEESMQIHNEAWKTLIKQRLTTMKEPVNVF